LHEAILLARALSPQAALIDDCPQDPVEVYADRGMVVQIVLNLLINAQQALAGQAAPPARIRVAIGAPEGDLVPVFVTDNGIGIAADKLVSIFGYDHTTDAEGHRFGLHDSANAARLMGGSLAAESPGPGLGATLTLRLRRHRPDTPSL
jgi:C4-dicarboxylate-specific signal transduction histidine kinase